MNEEEEKEMWKEVNRERIEMERKDQAYLKEVGKEKGWQIVRKIRKEFKESEGQYFEGFFEKPRGRLTESDHTDLETYVDQTVNGGYEGDHYAGTVDVKINDKKYLRFYYSM